MTSASDRRILLAYARACIVGFLRPGAPPPAPLPTSLVQRSPGLFVTVYLDGQLKGCIGHVQLRERLEQALLRLAQAAVSRDPRFTPLRAEELERTTIEISLLTGLQRLDDPLRQLKVGTHGVRVCVDQQTGVFLPKVALRRNWDPAQLLDGACEKAGLPLGAWRQGTVDVFEADVFSEAD